MNQTNGPIRLAVVDTDSGFVRVLAKRLESLGWQFRALEAPVPPHELVAMRLNALIIDVTLLGLVGLGLESIADPEVRVDVAPAR